MGTSPSKTSSATSPSKISLADTTPSKISSAGTTWSVAQINDHFKASRSDLIKRYDAQIQIPSSKISSAGTTPSMITSTDTSSKTSSLVPGTGNKRLRIRQVKPKIGIDYSKFDCIDASDTEDSDAEFQKLYQDLEHGMRDFSLR